MTRRFLAFALGAVLLGTAPFVGCGSEEPVPDALEEPAPEAAPARPAAGADTSAAGGLDFTLPRADGGTFRLSDHRGEVVLLNFWATWCLPCLAEMPALVALQDDLASQGLRVVGVSQDREGLEVIRPFAEEMAEKAPLNYPLLADPDLNVSAQFGGVPVLPATFVLDREGQIHASAYGALDRAEMLDLLGDLIDQEALLEE